MAPRFYGNKEAKCARLLQPKLGIIKGIGDVVKVTKNHERRKAIHSIYNRSFEGERWEGEGGCSGFSIRRKGTKGDEAKRKDVVKF